MRRTLALLLVASTLGCAHHEGLHGESDWKDVARYAFFSRTDIRYTPADWPVPLLADVHIPRSFGQQPAVLLVHGGDFSGGTRGDMRYIAERLAESGFVAVSVDFRLAPAHPHPAQLRDLEQALAWMRRNAESYQIDPARIGIWGLGSGGTLASLLAADSAAAGSRPRLRALVSGAGLYDLEHWERSEVLTQWLGRVDEAAFRSATPLRYVDSQFPPSFLYHGGLDLKIPVVQAETMRDSLRAHAVPAELFVVDGLGHSAMFILNRAALEPAIGFLRRRLLASAGP